MKRVRPPSIQKNHLWSWPNMLANWRTIPSSFTNFRPVSAIYHHRKRPKSLNRRRLRIGSRSGYSVLHSKCIVGPPEWIAVLPTSEHRFYFFSLLEPFLNRVKTDFYHLSKNSNKGKILIIKLATFVASPASLSSTHQTAN